MSWDGSLSTFRMWESFSTFYVGRTWKPHFQVSMQESKQKWKPHGQKCESIILRESRRLKCKKSESGTLKQKCSKESGRKNCRKKVKVKICRKKVKLEHWNERKKGKVELWKGNAIKKVKEKTLKWK